MNNCEFQANADNAFGNLVLASKYCGHIRIAPTPGTVRYATNYLDIAACLNWQCLKSNKGVLCTRTCEPFIQIICKQRIGGPRMLDRPVYIWMEITSLDDNSALLWDERTQSELPNLSSGPHLLHATNYQQDQDSGAFRVSRKFPLILKCNPVATEQYAKFSINLVARFDASVSHVTSFSQVKGGVRNIILAADLCNTQARELSYKHGIKLPSSSITSSSVRDLLNEKIERLLGEIPQFLDAKADVELKKNLTGIRSQVHNLDDAKLNKLLDLCSDNSRTPPERLNSIISLFKNGF